MLPTIFSPSELPSHFADFFSNKIRTIRENLDSVKISQPPLVKDHDFSGQPFTSFSCVTEADVRKVIAGSPRKSCELDPLPASLLFDCIDDLLPHITDIINASLSSGIFPQEYKSAVVRPLLKKPSLDPNSLKNYRPVSNLPFLSKVLERIVLSQLLAHLTQNNLIDPHQSAYRAGHSTETALMKVVNDLLLALDDGKVSILALLDLSAAFDTIDHDILLSRLQSSFGLHGTVLNWFRSYLGGRSQKIVANGFYSSATSLACGVPQGSVLGPVLFALYVRPVSDVINQHSLMHESFADDTQMYKSSTLSELTHTVSQIQQCFHDLKEWMSLNKLQLNDDKTELLLITPPRFLKHPSLPSSISIGASDISFSSQARNLGVTFEPTLSFKQHVANVCKVAYFEIRKISSVRHLLSAEATKTLVCSLVLSRLDYCNSLLAGSPKCLLNRLQKVQNSAARLVCRSSKQQHITPLLQSLHWLPIESRINYKLASVCFSSFCGTGPKYISDILQVYTPSRQLRSSTDTRLLRISSIRTKSFGQRSFCFQGPTVWNTLPTTVRHMSSTSSFKSALKTHLFKQV